jgi:hypothetical protein
MNLQAADQENEQRRRLEAAAAEALNTSEEVIKRNKLNQKKQQVRHASFIFLFPSYLHSANSLSLFLVLGITNEVEAFIFIFKIIQIA